MFSGRNYELQYLNNYYERDGSQIMVLYGEKNVGKTTLLSRFMADRPGYYYRARSASEREQRFLWGRELNTGTDEEWYPTFTEIFNRIPDAGVIAGNTAAGDSGNIRVAAENGTDMHTTYIPVRKKVIVIDEFQNIVRAGGGFMRELCAFVRGRKDAPVLVILASSSIGWVENSMITRIGEAAYALSGFFKIRALSFGTLMDFFPKFSMKQCVETYAVLGGIPGFWRHFDDKLDIKENICRYILNKDVFLHEEGLRIVERELRETGVYNTILAAIAAGKHKLNDLYHHTEFSRAKISVYLKNLMELELVEKVFSYDTEGKANTQKGIYRISNHFVHFYFTYIYPHLSSMETLGEKAYYDRYIAPYFGRYVAYYFKQVCREYIEEWNRNGELPVKVDRIGEWVGKTGIIDFVARSENGETLLGICNWENLSMDYGDYERLLSCAEKAKLGTEHIYLFSRYRFDERLRKEAGRNKGIKLFGMDAM